MNPNRGRVSAVMQALGSGSAPEPGDSSRVPPNGRGPQGGLGHGRGGSPRHAHPATPAVETPIQEVFAVDAYKLLPPDPAPARGVRAAAPDTAESRYEDFVADHRERFPQQSYGTSRLCSR